MTFNQRVNRTKKLESVPYIEHQVLQSEETVLMGTNTVTSRLKLSRYDTSEKLKHLRCSDFSLINLLSIGKDLNFTQSNVSNKLNIVDNL